MARAPSHDPGPSAARHYFRRMGALEELGKDYVQAFVRLIERARWAEISDPEPREEPSSSS